MVMKRPVLFAVLGPLARGGYVRPRMPEREGGGDGPARLGGTLAGEAVAG